MGGTNTSLDQYGSDGRPELHEGLIQKGISKATIQVRGYKHNPAENKIRWLHDQYDKLWHTTENDWKFIEGLTRLHRNGQVLLLNNGPDRYYYLPQGHRWLVEAFDPDLDKLQKAGLIRRPSINGEKRERIMKRTFWELTPSAKDLSDTEWSGDGEGDMGEGVVHRLGVWLAYWWVVETHEKLDHEYHANVLAKRYHRVNGSVMDVSVEYTNGEPRDTQSQELVIEVEADSRHVEATDADVWKLCAQRRNAWIFPTREVLVDVLQEMSFRGYTGLDESEIPETLAVRNHRDTYNHRLDRVNGRAPEAWQSMMYHPMQEVYTYALIAEDLREVRPELFRGESKESRDKRENQE
jgi:hypothetical protein